MKNTFDLHVHTRASDGVFTPTEVVRFASESGVKTIAITDHDNIDGIEEGMEAGKKMGVEVIAGVELSTQFEGADGIHILGYFIDHTDQTLLNFLAEFKEVRQKRGVKIVEAINRYLVKRNRVPLSLKRLKELAEGAVGRPHIGRLLIEMGYVKNVEEAFREYLVPFNIPKKKLPSKDAVELINNVGGIAVLAHPHMWNETREKVSRKDMEKKIRSLVDCGLVGLEAFYLGYTREDADFFCSLADDLGLEITAGTDYHSPTHPKTPLGFFNADLDIPQNLVEKLHERSLAPQGLNKSKTQSSFT